MVLTVSKCKGGKGDVPKIYGFLAPMLTHSLKGVGVIKSPLLLEI
jgi:hypothetical protein